jgi:hypothetical protein
MKHLIFVLAAMTVLAAACNKPSDTPRIPDQTQKTITTSMQGTSETPEPENEFDTKQWRLEGTNIIGATTGKIRGYYKDSKLSMLNSDKGIQITFPGDINNLQLLDQLDIESFSYNDATISTQLRYPNSNYQIDSVTFSCNNRLFKGIEDEPQIYENCKTNNKDIISQFVFTGISGIGFGTGGGYDLLWKKVYALKTPYTTLFILLPLEQDGYAVPVDVNSPYASAELKAQLKKQATKEYLDSLLTRPDNQNILKEFDALVEQIKVTK